MKEMLHNHRNHPAVIIWSVGNENRFDENFKQSYDFVKETDPTRPVMFSYPGNVPDSIKCYDILSMHYPSYQGNIGGQWGIKTEDQLVLLGDALSGRKFIPRWEKYLEWVDCVAETGVVYMPAGYSGMGQLLNYWMGVEGTTYAIYDWPDTVREVVDRINRNNLELIDLLAKSPAEIIVMGDNFSSDIQPHSFFDEWSKEYYSEAIRRLHSAGKYLAIHIDGRLKGSLKMFADIGADCADAVTPKPTGDLSPRECINVSWTKNRIRKSVPFYLLSSPIWPRPIP